MPLISTPGSISRKLALSVAALAAVVASCEWALRAVRFEHPREAHRRIVWNPERDAEIRRGDGLYRFDRVCLWSPRPGAEIPWTDGARINPDGFRGPQLPIEPNPGVVRIATLGGAAVLGVGVRWEDTFSARLVQILGEQGLRAEVLCAGAEDHTVVQGLERWRHVVRVWRPQVVICTFFGARELLMAPQGRMDQKRIEEMRAQPELGREWGVRDEYRVLHLASWLRDVASGVHWRERELAFIERRLGATLHDLEWPGQRRVPYDEFASAIGDLLNEIRADGALPILLSIPRGPRYPPSQVTDTYWSGALEVADGMQTLVLDGRNAFVRSISEELIPSEQMFLDELVPSECGHLALAQAIADRLLARRRGNR